MEKPKISILMMTYHRPQFIAGAIESALRQTFRDWEMIIVDDSADSATESIVGHFVQKDPRIQYFHRPQKGTIANASNFGLAKARGEFVAILDDDDWWSDDHKLEKQVAFLATHPNYVGCGGGFSIVNEHGEKTGEIMKQETDESIRRVALYANPMANSTTMFRRDVGIQYDESLPQFADWEFWLHVGTRGSLYNFPERFLAYRMWEHSASFTNQKQAADTGFRIVLRYRKEYPGFVGALVLVGIYRIYARFPYGFRKFFNASLSRLKKNIFSS